MDKTHTEELRELRALQRQIEKQYGTKVTRAQAREIRDDMAEEKGQARERPKGESRRISLAAPRSNRDTMAQDGADDLDNGIARRTREFNERKEREKQANEPKPRPAAEEQREQERGTEVSEPRITKVEAPPHIPPEKPRGDSGYVTDVTWNGSGLVISYSDRESSTINFSDCPA